MIYSKILFIIIIGILISRTLTVNAQNFEGVATYQSSRIMGDVSIERGHISQEMEEKMKMLKKIGQHEYELKFNLTESTWDKVERLESGDGATVTRSSFGSIGVKYKNTAKNLFLNETDLFGKIFLAESTLKDYEWELTNETKKIGNYSAQKAILTEVVERNIFSFDNDDKQATRIDTFKIEAWYTPEIPVSQGPDTFWGLPGLIMEMTDGRMTYLCTKLVLNPEGGVKTKVPTKGKKVTPEELKIIADDKLKEWLDKSRRKNN